MRNILIIFSLFCLSYSCEFHHRPDAPETFQQTKISGIDVFCLSKPTFSYSVIKIGKLNRNAPGRYADHAIAEALKYKCDAVILDVQMRSFECIKYTEVLPLYGLPKDTVLAMFTKNINRPVDSYCYSTPKRDFVVQYHGEISETRYKWMIAEAERKAMALNTDGVIIQLDTRTYDCINYKDDN